MDTIGTKTVVIGMSGGVDSSVAAILLKKQGYNVIGLFMKNWEELDDNGVCSSEKDYADVISVCEQLEIPYYSVEFIEEYRKQVFDDFIINYEKGLTPNPDILCNREIKFKVFFEKAMELGADYLATGHYCRIGKYNGEFALVKGDDPGKDQSYFLHEINGDVLDRVLFPLGSIHKAEVRKIASKFNLSNKNKKDSTGICFIGERNFKEFLSRFITFKPGSFVNLDGTVVGTHSGASFYTIGQRKGLGLGGPGEPWYVIDKNMDKNEVIVERGENHPALYAHELWVDDIHWINPRIEWQEKQLFCKIRYRQSDQKCFLEKQDTGFHITFPEPQRAITPGQSIVFYMDNGEDRICLGGGVIKKRGPSLFELP
jgi:tRNA-specific 2-thiouridylase